MGSTGRPGQDGNTILTSEGTPRPDLGVVGDYVIDKTKWNIYGPKSSGGWGSPTPLRGNGKGAAVTKRDLSDGVPTTGDGGGGGGLRYNTSNLPLTGFGRGGKGNINAPGGNIIPEGNNLTYQSNLNRWIVDSLQALDDALPVSVGDVLPDDGEYEGDLFLKDGLLYIYTRGEWIAVGGESGPPVYVGEDAPPNTAQTGQLWFCTSPDDLTLYVYDGAVWVPAAPPVSLDGIEASISNIDEQLLRINANVAMNKSELDEKALDIQLDQDRQDAELQDLHKKIDGIAEEFDRGKWAHVTEKPTVGQYALGVKATKEYCQDQYAKCVEDADGDPTKLSVCTRQMGDCENKEDEGGSVYVSRWGQVDHISIHTEESDGSTHGFGDYTADKYIEIVNEGDEGNATYIITEDAKIEDGVAILAVNDIQSTGVPSGLGRFKVFEMKSGDPTDYVRKAGDLMNGGLQIQPKKDTETGLVVFAGKNLPSESKGTVFAVTNARGHEILRVHNHGRIRAGGREIDYTPEDDSDLVTKKYVDQMGLLPGPARLAWRWLGSIDGAKEPEDGGFYKSGDYLRISFKTDNNIDLGDNLFPDTQFLSTQYGPFGTIWKYNKKDNKWQMMRQIRVDGFRWNYNNHMEYNLSSSHGRSFNDLVVGQAYYITIGGFF